MIEKINFNQVKRVSKKIINSDNLKKVQDVILKNSRNNNSIDRFDFSSPKILDFQEANLKLKLLNISLKTQKFDNSEIPTDDNGKCSKLNPNLVVINLDKVREMGIDGKDVVVAVVDSGIIYNHPDIERDRIIFYKDFSGESNEDNPKDLLGHGTHVASLIGGTGKMSKGYNQGISPGVKFVILRITSVSEIIKALEWIKDNGKKYNIKVVNLSLGVDPKTGYLQDAIASIANELAKDYTIVAAAGNDYANETIDSPGIAPNVITVGGIDTKNTCSTADDTIYDASSKGPTPFDLLDKPDVVAPAKKLAGARVPGSVFDPYKADKSLLQKDKITSYQYQYYPSNNSNNSNGTLKFLATQDDNWNGNYYITLSGTSGATAIVSGIASLIYQVLPNATPKLVKEIIMKTAKKMKDPSINQEYDKYTQGAGLVDAFAAVKYALALKDKQDNNQYTNQIATA